MFDTANMRRSAVVVGALLASVLGLTHGEAAGTRTYVRSDCVHSRYEPTHIILACGDGNAWLSKIDYTRWGSERARGSARLNYNDCTPDCADGHLVHKTSTFILDTVRNSDGHRLFGRARVYVDGRLWSTSPLIPDCAACRR